MDEKGKWFDKGTDLIPGVLTANMLETYCCRQNPSRTTYAVVTWRLACFGKVQIGERFCRVPCPDKTQAVSYQILGKPTPLLDVLPGFRKTNSSCMVKK